MEIIEKDIGELREHPKNPKVHPNSQIMIIEESIKQFGWTNPVILAKDGKTVLAGHARVKAAELAGIKTIPCIHTNLDGSEADAYVLTDNRTADLAPYDTVKLNDLLVSLPDDLLYVTGFEPVQIASLTASSSINTTPEKIVSKDNIDYDDEWEGMPEFKQENLESIKSIIVHFESISDMQDFSQLIKQTITENTKSIWYPKQEPRDSRVNGVYIDES